VLTAIAVDRRLTDTPPALAGRRAAPALTFEGFYLANERRLFRALYVVTGDRHETEDLMQTAFCKVWERWDRVGQLDDPVGYLFRTAFNTHRSATRRTLRAARRLVGWAMLRPAAVPEPDELAELRDETARVLEVLTPRQREAVVLTSLLGYGAADAAEVMGIRPATVRVLVSQARSSLAGTGDTEADG
jgi:RNA polymerase sigma-70 factor (ECF subfamily)